MWVIGKIPGHKADARAEVKVANADNDNEWREKILNIADSDALKCHPRVVRFRLQLAFLPRFSAFGKPASSLRLVFHMLNVNIINLFSELLLN